jgi:hypothetical protein
MRWAQCLKRVFRIDVAWYRYKLPDDKFFPSGKLALKLNAGWYSGLRSTWADGKKQRVEHCLNKFIATLYKAAANKKAARIEREREAILREERERRREILRQKIEQEIKRVDRFTAQAKSWHEAEQIRSYVLAARSAGYYSLPGITGRQNIDEWCAWALDQANRLDPTVSSSPSVLDYKDNFYCFR